MKKKHKNKMKKLFQTNANGNASHTDKPMPTMVVVCHPLSIVGTRYHKKGRNYDLCEAEFNKWNDFQKLEYEVFTDSVGF